MSAPQAEVLLAALQAVGITHVVGIPDNGSAALFNRLDAAADIRRIAVTREGEAFAVAAGLWVGGARPAVLIQNTGLLESGDSLRGTAVRMGVPLLCLVGYRGYAALAASGIHPQQRPDDPYLLVRNDLDSAALVTEPTLRAWGIPLHHYAADSDAALIAAAQEQARREQRPVALLLTHGLT